MRNLLPPVSYSHILLTCGVVRRCRVYRRGRLRTIARVNGLCISLAVVARGIRRCSLVTVAVGVSSFLAGCYITVRGDWRGGRPMSSY